MTIPIRITVADWYALEAANPHDHRVPIALTSAEIDALLPNLPNPDRAFAGRAARWTAAEIRCRQRPIAPGAQLLGRPIIEVPDWPDWMP